MEESLRKEFGSALARLVEARQGRGDLDEAIGYARTWLELDPLHEPAHQALIRLHFEAGDRAAAIDQYRTCVRVLSEELAVAPLEETTRFYEAITAGAEPAPQARVRTTPDDGTGVAVEELPLTGRQAEETVLRDAARAEARLIVIEGEPGIGKTRLASVLVGAMGDAGRNAVMVRSHEEEAGHAFGVASRLLHRALDAASTSAVRGIDVASATEALRLVPELRDLREDLDEPSSLDSPGAQTSFFHGVWETLVALAGTGAAVIVDDAQWCDRGTVELVAYGIRRLDRLPITIALTWRRDEIGPDHLLRHVLADARRSGVAQVLNPGRLDEREVAALVDNLGIDSPDLARRLYQETEGVPFFIAEYLKVTAAATGEWPVAAGVRDLVRTQVARLSGVAQQVMTAAAVVGRDVTVDLLEAVSGRAPDEVADAIDELERRGLLVASGDKASYDFSHEKVRRVVSDDTSLARRRLLHGRAAHHLEHLGETALAAYHAREAGQEADAARLFASAGEHARQLFANEEALRHLEAALALGHPDTPALHEAIGNIHTLMGRYGEARASYEAALAFVHERGTEARLERLLGSLFLRRGEAGRAEAHLRRATELAVDPADASRALAELALATAEAGTDAALPIAERAVVSAETTGDDETLARAYSVAGLLLARAGKLDDARERLRGSAQRAAGLTDPSPHVAALNNLALVERDAGETEAALDLLDEAIKLSEKQGDLHRVAALHNNAADVLHELGRTEESQAHSRSAAELFARVGEDPTREPGIWKLVSW